ILQSVNKELAPIKSHYFLYNAATGPMVQFLPTIGKQLGFSATIVGTIYTVLPISGLIAKPLFGSLADKFKLHKTFLIFEAILTIAFFSIYFIPEMDRSASVTLICNNDLPFLEICPKIEFSKKALSNVILEVHSNAACQLTCKGVPHGFLELFGKNVSVNSTFEFGAGFDVYQDLLTKDCVDVRLRTFLDGTAHGPVCGGQLRTSCTATCKNNSAFNHLLQEAKDSQSDISHSTYQFHIFLWAAIISWIGMAVVVSIADAICFDLLGHERRNDYGKQKMWGSIGFGIFGISAGYLIDLSSKEQYDKDYTCIFYIMLVAMVADIVVSATLKKKNPECSVDEPSLFRELLSVFKEGRVLVFAWWCIGAGMCTEVIWNFLFWYSEDLTASSHVTWSKTLQGL
ncbi:major facilitator superfamily domain-containing protein 6-like, partial [Temnothorax curvispinosus]|uniref:Major facilitator superfamily domain-containing protein 6-like n=1 Tax=Temnothorax curvispinosus TaxID=300111 RepID=A0A6J1R6C4_9HYME